MARLSEACVKASWKSPRNANTSLGSDEAVRPGHLACVSFCRFSSGSVTHSFRPRSSASRLSAALRQLRTERGSQPESLDPVSSDDSRGSTGMPIQFRRYQALRCRSGRDAKAASSASWSPKLKSSSVGTRTALRCLAPVTRSRTSHSPAALERVEDCSAPRRRLHRFKTEQPSRSRATQNRYSQCSSFSSSAQLD